MANYEKAAVDREMQNRRRTENSLRRQNRMLHLAIALRTNPGLADSFSHVDQTLSTCAKDSNLLNLYMNSPAEARDTLVQSNVENMCNCTVDRKPNNRARFLEVVKQNSWKRDDNCDNTSGIIVDQQATLWLRL